MTHEAYAYLAVVRSSGNIDCYVPLKNHHEWIGTEKHCRIRVHEPGVGNPHVEFAHFTENGQSQVSIKAFGKGVILNGKELETHKTQVLQPTDKITVFGRHFAFYREKPDFPKKSSQGTSKSNSDRQPIPSQSHISGTESSSQTKQLPIPSVPQSEPITLPSPHRTEYVYDKIIKFEDVADGSSQSSEASTIQAPDLTAPTKDDTAEDLHVSYTEQSVYIDDSSSQLASQQIAVHEDPTSQPAIESCSPLKDSTSTTTTPPRPNRVKRRLSMSEKLEDVTWRLLNKRQREDNNRKERDLQMKDGEEGNHDKSVTGTRSKPGIKRKKSADSIETDLRVDTEPNTKRPKTHSTPQTTYDHDIKRNGSVHIKSEFESLPISPINQTQPPYGMAIDKTISTSKAKPKSIFLAQKFPQQTRLETPFSFTGK